MCEGVCSDTPSLKAHQVGLFGGCVLKNVVHEVQPSQFGHHGGLINAKSLRYALNNLQTNKQTNKQTNSTTSPIVSLSYSTLHTTGSWGVLLSCVVMVTSPIHQ